VPALLIVNPNTSPEVTALLARHAIARAPQGWSVRTATAAFGPRYITGEVGAAVAGHAALEAYAADAAAHGEPQAVLLGCFGDPGLFALRALVPAPVLGLAEAAMRAAAARGRFAIVTGGAAWAPMLVRLAGTLGLAEALAGVQAVDRSGGELAADPAAAAVLLEAAGREALRRWPDCGALLLGGAGLAGMAEGLDGRLPVPVLDNVALALGAAFAAGAAACEPATAAPGSDRGTLPSNEPGPWTGLAPALMRRLAP
jgi:Asp/Glu/hydantoin racemase